MEGCPLATTKNHISLKRIWNYAYYLAHKIQNFLGTAPLQPRKSYIKILTEKDWNCAYVSPKYTFS